jgi:hypothetical protein
VVASLKQGDGLRGSSGNVTLVASLQQGTASVGLRTREKLAVVASLKQDDAVGLRTAGNSLW